MLPATVPDQRFNNGFFRSFDPPIPKFRQFYRIPLASQNRFDDPKTRDTGNVADHVMDLQIHLIQGFLRPQ